MNMSKAYFDTEFDNLIESWNNDVITYTEYKIALKKLRRRFFNYQKKANQ